MNYSVEKMCKIMRVNKSGYYHWVKGMMSKRVNERKTLVEQIKEVHNKSKQTYGSPRITDELRSQGHGVSYNRIARIMKEEGIRSKLKKKYRITTDSSHKYPVADNILARDFSTTSSTTRWVSDITYVKTREGWLYLTIILDLWDRKVIGWALSNNLTTTDTVITAWNMAIGNRPLSGNLIFHSDRGVQYASTKFTNYLKAAKCVQQSMSRKANCWDNAVAESFFKTLKTELIYHCKYNTRLQAEISIFEYIETWYNRNRRHSALGGKTILEYQKLTNYKYAA